MITNKMYNRAILLSLIAILPFLACQLVQAQSLSKSQTSSGYPGAPDIHPGLTQALQSLQKAQGGAQSASSSENLQLVGFLNLGISSDVWAHDDFAYVGGFGAFQTVKVVDISDPTNPQLVTELPTTDGTSPQDVKVEEIETPFFDGDLLVVANDFGAAPPPFGGIQLWDVTDPLNPIQLSAPRIAPVHNVFLFQRDDRAFVLLASPFLEVASHPPSVFAPSFAQPMGDFVIVEVTDPTNPQVIGDWGAGKDGGFPFGFASPIPPIGFPANCTDPSICRGASASVNCHDVWANEEGTVAYLSYWDLGLILLDISDPSNPTLIGRGIAPSTFGNDEGNLHNAVPADDGDLVITGDEDFNPLPSGFLRIFDTEDTSNPVQISAFATDGSLNDPSGSRTMHNIFIPDEDDDLAFLSWYDEGIRVLDIDDPSNPREIAAFIPDPVATGPGLFWGIFADDDLVFASDILSGLFILELEDDEEEDDEEEEEEEEEEEDDLDKTIASGIKSSVPGDFFLFQNHPNPFNPETEIRFQLPEASHVVIRIINTLGQEIRILAERQYETGYHNVRWDGKDNNGNLVSSGIYLYQLKAGAFSQIKKMSLIR